MLLYASVGISELEIPSKRSLAIYISNCQHKCKNCHTPYLHNSYGDILKNNFETIFIIYYQYFDIVCFMGEGKETQQDRNEMIQYCKYIHENNKLVALYSGRDCDIESWMYCFDYVKIGSYQESNGPIIKSTTNQKLFKKDLDKYKEITYMFWQNN